MQHILYMEIIGCLSERGFSLDELVVKTKRLFEEKGMSGFIELLLKLVDESLCIGLSEEMVVGNQRVAARILFMMVMGGEKGV